MSGSPRSSASPKNSSHHNNNHPAKQRILSPCVNCRRRKRKCSGDRPVCAFCAKNNLDCHWTEVTKRGPRKGYIEELEHKAGVGESCLRLLDQLLRTVPRDQWPQLAKQDDDLDEDSDIYTHFRDYYQVQNLSDLRSWYIHATGGQRSDIQQQQVHHTQALSIEELADIASNVQQQPHGNAAQHQHPHEQQQQQHQHRPPTPPPPPPPPPPGPVPPAPSQQLQLQRAVTDAPTGPQPQTQVQQQQEQSPGEHDQDPRMSKYFF